MAIFQKCPVCGKQAIVRPELATEEHRVFRCRNGHKFKKTIKMPPKENEREVIDHLPEWAKILYESRKRSRIRPFH